jgi:hypothetical protein
LNPLNIELIETETNPNERLVNHRAKATRSLSGLVLERNRRRSLRNKNLTNSLADCNDLPHPRLFVVWRWISLVPGGLSESVLAELL